MTAQTTTYESYDTYKDSGVEWIGKMPVDWDQTYLMGIADESKEKNVIGQENNLLSLSYGRIVRRDIDTDFGLLPASFHTYNIVNPGMIVLRLTDLQNDKKSLRTGFVEERGIITSAYVSLKLKDDVNNKKYIHYLLHSYDINKVFYSLGGGVRQQMKYSDLKHLAILLPPVLVQNRITEYLDKKTKIIDLIIEKKQKLVELLQEKRQALITQAVTKGLDPNAKLKDSGVEWIGEIPDGWEIRKLKKLFYSHETGIWGEEENGSEDDVICIRVADFDYAHLRISDEEKTLRNITKTDLYKKRLRKGDLLLEKSGGGEKTIVGRAVLFESSLPAVCANFIEFHRFNNLIYPKYGLYLFAALYSSGVIYKNIKQTTGIQNLDLTGLYSQLVVYPDIQIQKEIVDHLDSKTSEIDCIRDLLQKQINKLQEFKSALIYNAVTGKIKV